MARGVARVAGIAVLALVGASPVAADSYWEVEAARANARAGGPTNARDAELLERYGCLSGTNSEFCRKLAGDSRRAHRAEKRRQRTKQ